jgi:hypothetical protein
MLFGKEPILSAIMSSAMVLFMSSAMAHMSLRRNCGEVDAIGTQAVTGGFTAKFSKLAFRRTPLWLFLTTHTTTTHMSQTHFPLDAG